jgi:hypothetical protein
MRALAFLLPKKKRTSAFLNGCTEAEVSGGIQMS